MVMLMVETTDDGMVGKATSMVAKEVHMVAMVNRESMLALWAIARWEGKCV